MDCKEIAEKLKTDADLLVKLDNLRQGFHLEKLYFIYLNEQEAVWGIRKTETSPSINQIRQYLWLFLIHNFNAAYSQDQVKVLSQAFDEVDQVMANSDLGAYIQSHGGSYEINDVNENEGLVVMSLNGTCSTCASSMLTMRLGVENFLKETLPWVKKVETPDDPQEPDFGIKEILEQAERERRFKNDR
jgi:Fe-S cluster biogenesis protein NfuA